MLLVFNSFGLDVVFGIGYSEGSPGLVKEGVLGKLCFPFNYECSNVLMVTVGGLRGPGGAGALVTPLV